MVQMTSEYRLEKVEKDLEILTRRLVAMEDQANRVEKMLCYLTLKKIDGEEQENG